MMTKSSSYFGALNAFFNINQCIDQSHSQILISFFLYYIFYVIFPILDYKYIIFFGYFDLYIIINHDLGKQIFLKCFIDTTITILLGNLSSYLTSYYSDSRCQYFNTSYQILPRKYVYLNCITIQTNTPLMLFLERRSYKNYKRYIWFII